MWRSRLPKLIEAVFVALDTETTGLNPATGKLVEIGAVRFDWTGAVEAEFNELVNPGEPMPPEAKRIHGITDEMVALAPQPEAVLPRLLKFMEGPRVVLVAHNAPFDLAFISMALSRMGQRPPALPVLDTRLMARDLFPALSGYSLEQVAAHFDLKLPNHHRALPDADAVRVVFCHMLDYLEEEEFAQLPSRIRVLTFEDVAMAPAQAPPGFEELARALEEGLDLVIRYEGGTKGTGERSITPLALYRQDEYIYLSALCHEDRKEKSFRLDRVVSLRVAG